MKLKILVTVGLMSTSSLTFLACSDTIHNNTTSESAGGGAPGIESEIDELRETIDELQKQIEQAGQEEIAALEEALEKAKERLKELETCQNGGNCTGYDDALAFTALSDAYCEWVFACCRDDEIRTTIGAAAGDSDGCKSMYRDTLERGQADLYMPGVDETVGVYQLSQYGHLIQAGELAIDGDALDACAQQISNQSCGDAEPAAPLECGETPKNACQNLVVGLQKKGEPCEAFDYGSIDTCAPGLSCVGHGSVGVCQENVAEDDFCQDDADCESPDAALYCDENVGKCKKQPTDGEPCAFDDPTFDSIQNLRGNLIPCVQGTFCSFDSLTCVTTARA